MCVVLVLSCPSQRAIVAMSMFPAERRSAAGGEHWVLGLSLAFFEPSAQHRDGLGGQGDGAAFPSLACHLDVGAGGQAHVGDRERDELGDAHAGQDCEQHERVVAAAEPAGTVGRLEQRLDLVEVEVTDCVLFVALGRDREHPPERREVLWVPEAGVAAERVDRGQPVVARPGAVAPVAFEVVEEGADQRRVEVVDVQPAGLLAGPLRGEGKQQPERGEIGVLARCEGALFQYPLSRTRRDSFPSPGSLVTMP
jgi:hypothetical protein